MLPRSAVLRLAVLLVALAGTAAAQVPGADPSPHSEAALVTDVAAAVPGGSVDVALRLRLDDGWHAYWLNPGDAGLPVRVAWTLPAGATAGSLRFPPPETVTLAGLASFAHGGEAYFFTTVAVPADARGTFSVTGEATWLVCADVCLPARATVSLTLPVGDAAGRSADAPAVEAARDLLPVPAEGWTATAAATDGAYALTLRPPDGVRLDGAVFYPLESDVLAHGAPQAWRAEGAAWAASLTADSSADAPVERLRGVLAVPGARAVEIDAEIAGATMSAATDGPAPAGRLAGMLGLALVGGLLLNLMPCVFPVLSLKVMSFAQGHDAPTLRRHGLAFGAGVVGSFVALAAVLVALRAGGAALGWGFQLQSPPVVAALAGLMTVLALGLFGVVEIGTGVASAGARLDRFHGTTGAFLSGVLAVVVASPCTAPLMGAALGWALAQPAAVALVVFAVLGVGMALPVVALSFAPGVAQRLPRPGAWMETLKQALAFPLLLTAVWLVWVFGRQTGLDGAAALLAALVTLSLAVWTVGRWPAARATRRARTLSRTLAALLAVAAVALVAAASTGGVTITGGSADDAADAATRDAWQPFDAGRVDALVADGQAVFVDYTAAWCLTCQVNKRTTLRTAAVDRAFRDAGVVRVEADWTDRDAAIEASLAAFGRSGVPLYVLYPGGGRSPVLLPEVLTPGIVLAALADVSPPSTTALR